MSVGMKKNKPNKKIFFFNGVSLKLIWILLLTRFFSYNIYVFDISRRPIELKLLLYIIFGVDLKLPALKEKLIK